MFETAELGRKVGKKEFKERLPALREALLLAQVRIREAQIPVLVLFAGVDGAGKGATANLLNSWLDPRWIRTRVFGQPSQEEAEQPRFWRYWRELPPKGLLGVFLSAWYSQPLLQRVYGEISEGRFAGQLDEVMAFERMLTDDGLLLLKFWMHLGKKAQKKRLESLEKDPLQSWRVTERDWKHWRKYDAFVGAGEQILMRTSTGNAPWHLVEGSDANYRSLRVGEEILAAVQRRLERKARLDAAAAAKVEPPVIVPDAAGEVAGPEADPLKEATSLNVLSGLDLHKKLGKKPYEEQLERLQGELHLVHRGLRERGVSTVLVFEGWDAAGKGGAIRRLVSALDARSVRVHPVAAPTDEEKAQHYLWRFWRNLPRAGQVAIFDRSWYGRVLVERIEGFASEAEWRRAYGEINAFERQLADHGVILLKFWIHISPEEQLARFKLREETPYKRWKLTDEDWRNRAQWGIYEQAVHDLVERTSTKTAPWVLVEGNDKRYARVKVLRSVCDEMVRVESLLNGGKKGDGDKKGDGAKKGG